MHDIGKDGSAGKEVVVKDDNHKRPENAPSATFAPPDGLLILKNFLKGLSEIFKNQKTLWRR